MIAFNLRYLSLAIWFNSASQTMRTATHIPCNTPLNMYVTYDTTHLFNIQPLASYGQRQMRFMQPNASYGQRQMKVHGIKRLCTPGSSVKSSGWLDTTGAGKESKLTPFPSFSGSYMVRVNTLHGTTPPASLWLCKTSTNRKTETVPVIPRKASSGSLEACPQKTVLG